MTREAQRRLALLAMGAALLLGTLALWGSIGRGGSRGHEPAPAAGSPALPTATGTKAGAETIAVEHPEARSTVPREATPESTEAPLATPPAIRGRVVEARTGNGVPEVLVGSRVQLNMAMNRQRKGGDSSPTEVARTDEDGFFSLADVDEKVERLVAVHFDYAPAAAERPPDGWKSGVQIVIRLEQGPHVYGTALTDEGEPAADVHVRVFGEGWPRGVSTTTDADGAYRTPAVHAGPIDVVATPPWDPSERESGFTTEWRQAEISTLDLRVDFGPNAQHVTWHGQVLDENHRALAAGRLRLEALDAPGRADWTRKQLRNTDFLDGSFEFKKLRPGVGYNIQLELDEESRLLELGVIRFEAPGLVERDLLLAGHAMLGRVVDRDSGGPPAQGGGVYAVRRGASGSGVNRKLDDEGRFRLRGLTAGIYDLYVNAAGYSSKRHEGVQVGGGDSIAQPILVEVSRGAALVVRLVGHDAGMNFALEFEPEGGATRSSGGRTDEEGHFEGEWTFEPGIWTVFLNAHGAGRATRVVPLGLGGRGEALFLPSDLERDQSLVAVEGSLRWASGEAIAGAFIMIYIKDAELPQDHNRLRQAMTDEEGRFRIEGLLPGRCYVNGALPDGEQVDFDDLIVPPQPSHPISLHLLVPEGRVRGRLSDGSTGAPLASDGPRWWAFLKEVEGGRIEAELQGGMQGPTFELTGVPEGRYRLLIHGRGYFDEETEPFDVGEGEVHDLGEIRLRPSAVLAVEVTDPEGAPLESFSVSVHGAQLNEWDSYDRSPGRARWDGLPAGSVSVSVSADGMLDAVQVLDLREGALSEAHFELRAE